jgi:hypothetical protein
VFVADSIKPLAHAVAVSVDHADVPSRACGAPDFLDIVREGRDPAAGERLQQLRLNRRVSTSGCVS